MIYALVPITLNAFLVIAILRMYVNLPVLFSTLPLPTPTVVFVHQTQSASLPLVSPQVSPPQSVSPVALPKL